MVSQHAAMSPPSSRAQYADVCWRNERSRAAEAEGSASEFEERKVAASVAMRASEKSPYQLYSSSLVMVVRWRAGKDNGDERTENGIPAWEKFCRCLLGSCIIHTYLCKLGGRSILGFTFSDDSCPPATTIFSDISLPMRGVERLLNLVNAG